MQVGYLVAIVAAWLYRLGVMSPAEELPFAVKVEQVDEQFGTDGTGKTLGMPRRRMSRALCRHHQIRGGDWSRALNTKSVTPCTNTARLWGKHGENLLIAIGSIYSESKPR